MPTNRLEMALQAFDDLNSEDPKKISWEGKEVPFEWIYAHWMTSWVEKLSPEPSDVLRLAARCQHLCRWMIPRSDFDPGKIGYLKWRKYLYQFHAEKAGETLRKFGFDEETVLKVQAINLKKNLKDPDTQTIEDSLCLVFLEYQFRDFLQKTPPEKMPGIVKKTWVKMSPRAQNFALNLPFSEEEFTLLKKFLEE